MAGIRICPYMNDRDTTYSLFSWYQLRGINCYRHLFVHNQTDKCLDADQIDSWAEKAMASLVESGIMELDNIINSTFYCVVGAWDNIINFKRSIEMMLYP